MAVFAGKNSRPGNDRHFARPDYSTGVINNCRSPMNAKLLSLFPLVFASDLAVANSVHDRGRTDSREFIVSRIPHREVESSAIASIGYSRRRHLLEIEFVNGAVYRYLQITPSMYRDLMAANSKARYYDLNIKGNYCSVRVRPRSDAKP